MTKKKRNHPDVEEVLNRPWCYYCERDFDDLKILINHQKAKHFKCERCGRRLNTAGGLSVHMSQVHKENLTAVDNALPNRAGLDIEIFGIEGIPEEIANQHTQRVLTAYHQAEAERRTASGNQAAGPGGGNVPKKPKFESPSDLKKRLAEHKAKVAAEQANGGSSGSATPSGAGQGPQQPSVSQDIFIGSPQNAQYQQPYGVPPASAGTPFGHAPASGAQYYQNPPAPASYSQPPSANGPYNLPLPSYGQPQPPNGTYNQPLPYAQPTPQPLPYSQQTSVAYPSQPSFSPPPHQNHQHPAGFSAQPAYSPAPYQTHSPYQAQLYQSQPFSPPITQNGHPSFQGPPGGPTRPFGAGSPMQPYQPHQQMPPRMNTPPQNGIFPQRSGSGSLPAAPGLPQRPAFGAPPVNAFQFQQMHQGQIPATPNSAVQQQHPGQGQAPNNHQPQMQSQGLPNAVAPPPGRSQQSPTEASLDDLISSASKQVEATTTVLPAQAPPSPTKEAAEVILAKDEPVESKGGKKEKEKPKAIRMVYSDDEISPEEKMAQMARYAFTPGQKSIMV